jgi:hypothetical protein
VRIGKLRPFRVFVSSPVDGIEKFRIEVMKVARAAENGGKFKFFFYEYFENARIPGKTVCESIFESSGEQFDALFIFFKDRVGAGTIEELDYFETKIIPKNPDCKVWWSQIHSDQKSEDVTQFVGRLLNYSTGLPIVPGDEIIKRPSQLTGRLIAKLLSLDEEMLRQSETS